jgi:hypothetical protein
MISTKPLCSNLREKASSSLFRSNDTLSDKVFPRVNKLGIEITPRTSTATTRIGRGPTRSAKIGVLSGKSNFNIKSRPSSSRSRTIGRYASKQSTFSTTHDQRFRHEGSTFLVRTDLSPGMSSESVKMLMSTASVSHLFRRTGRSSKKFFSRRSGRLGRARPVAYMRLPPTKRTVTPVLYNILYFFQ